MLRDLSSKVKAFTLIEIIISMSIMSMLMVALLFQFNFHFYTYEEIYHNIRQSDNLRYFSIILEKQIAMSPCIYIYRGKVYLQDLEKPIYLNYYNFSNNIIYKNKVNENFASIGTGAKSQAIRDIDSFSLEYVKENKIHLMIHSEYEGKEIQINKLITFKGKVIQYE